MDKANQSTSRIIIITQYRLHWPCPLKNKSQNLEFKSYVSANIKVMGHNCMVTPTCIYIFYTHIDCKWIGFAYTIFDVGFLSDKVCMSAMVASF